MNIKAVVVTFNRKDLLLECVEAIMNQTYEVSSLIIIDNNSTDGTYELLLSKNILDNDKVLYNKLDKNIGGAGGFYEGIKLASKDDTDWIWIMDDDTIPTKNALEELVKASKLIKGKTSFLASTVYGMEGETMNVPTISLEKEDNGYTSWYKYLDKGIVKISTATFVSLLIDVNAVRNVGLPCKDYFIWGDDIEYTMRLIKYYGDAYFVGNSKVIHKRKGGSALSLFSEDNINRINMYYYSYRNDLINANEYFGRKRMLKLMYWNTKTMCKIMLKSKHKLKKVQVILKAMLAFVLKKYDHRAFKNRFNYNS